MCWKLFPGAEKEEEDAHEDDGQGGRYGGPFQAVFRGVAGQGPGLHLSEE